MEEDRLSKRAMAGRGEGRRLVGRPRMRWYDNAMEETSKPGPIKSQRGAKGDGSGQKSLEGPSESGDVSAGGLTAN